MDERLSAATAMVGLMSDAGRIAEKLWELPSMTRVLHEMKHCRSTVHVLFQAFCQLETSRLPFPERASWIAVDDLVAALTDSVLALAELQLCDAASLDGLCSRIHWQLLSMSMMATILKCPGVADAAYARVGLQRRMARILTSDTALARRMRLSNKTIFSGCTLADVPALSLVLLPVSTAELGFGRELYSALDARLLRRELGGFPHGAMVGPSLARSDTACCLGRSSTTGSESGCDGEVEKKAPKRRFCIGSKRRRPG
ncbi:hypothetical protein XA68_16625 [Ophiocordyceps unilateralis]|uniref:Uncharacterized protein n=1 Tax=Ophiocordyceps unilateralis TaxID=268505 RepID=A0A2A9PTF3_OPHUN|nr:hypothetical protein XA68_16625 [Ophiocordyceps unilateralis]